MTIDLKRVKKHRKLRMIRKKHIVLRIHILATRYLPGFRSERQYRAETPFTGDRNLSERGVSLQLIPEVNLHKNMDLTDL